jgi:hypothetical protein
MLVFRLCLILALCTAGTSAWAKTLTLECTGTIRITSTPETGPPNLDDVPYYKVVVDLDAKTVSGFWAGANGPLALPITATTGQVLTFKDHMILGISEDESIEGTVDRATGRVVAASTHRSGIGTIMPFTGVTCWSLECKPSERH